ncbi:hypothetical protein FQZ97_982080 [compost metagenome]
MVDASNALPKRAVIGCQSSGKGNPKTSVRALSIAGASSSWRVTVPFSDRQPVCEQDRARLLGGQGHQQVLAEKRLRMGGCRDVRDPIGVLSANPRRSLIDRHPIATKFRFQQIAIERPAEAERLMRRRLRCGPVETERRGRHATAKADIDEIAATVHEDAEHHVRPSRRRRLGFAHPQDAGHQGLHPIAERAEYTLQKAVLFEAIAATPAVDELGVDRLRRQIDPSSEQHVDGFEMA